MVKRVLDVGMMQIASSLSSFTGASVLDVSEQEGALVFVVAEGDVGKAVGPQGSKVKRVEELLKRKIKIVEFNSELKRFVENVIAPVRAKYVELDGDVVVITPVDFKSRGVLIGKNASDLRLLESVVKRFFSVSKVKIQEV